MSCFLWNFDCIHIYSVWCLSIWCLHVCFHFGNLHALTTRCECIRALCTGERASSVALVWRSISGHWWWAVFKSIPLNLLWAFAAHQGKMEAPIPMDSCRLILHMWYILLYQESEGFLFCASDGGDGQKLTELSLESYDRSLICCLYLGVSWRAAAYVSDNFSCFCRICLCIQIL